jgi:hypothetical protein
MFEYYYVIGLVMSAGLVKTRWIISEQTINIIVLFPFVHP